MNSADRAPFAAALTGMAETYRAEISEATLEGYWIALNHLSLDQVRAGIAAAMRTCEFMPKPSNIIAAAKATDPQPGLHDGTNYALPAESREERSAEAKRIAKELKRKAGIVQAHGDFMKSRRKR